VVLSRMDYCNSLFICSSQSTLSSSATCARRRCCKTSLWRTSSNACGTGHWHSSETAPPASSVKSNSFQTMHTDVRHPTSYILPHSTSYTSVNVVMTAGLRSSERCNSWSSELSCTWRTKPSQSHDHARGTLYRLTLNSRHQVPAFGRNLRLNSTNNYTHII